MTEWEADKVSLQEYLEGLINNVIFEVEQKMIPHWNIFLDDHQYEDPEFDMLKNVNSKLFGILKDLQN